jgi:hypothetical protein
VLLFRVGVAGGRGQWWGGGGGLIFDHGWGLSGCGCGGAVRHVWAMRQPCGMRLMVALRCALCAAVRCTVRELWL